MPDRGKAIPELVGANDLGHLVYQRLDFEDAVYDDNAYGPPQIHLNCVYKGNQRGRVD